MREDESRSRAGIYVRISRDRTGEEVGIDRQERECRALWEARGWTVTGVYPDGDISACSGKHRPGGARMLDDLKGGAFDVLVA